MLQTAQDDLQNYFTHSPSGERKSSHQRKGRPGAQRDHARVYRPRTAYTAGHGRGHVLVHHEHRLYQQIPFVNSDLFAVRLGGPSTELVTRTAFLDDTPLYPTCALY